MKTALIFLALFTLTNCSSGGDVKHKRGPEFFAPMVNPAENFDQARPKLNELKLITSHQKYNMRMALFDNGKFFYEVENLGHGEGVWKFRDGYVNLYASRAMFDIDINLFASEATGDALSMQFLDRFGHNAVKAHFRPPAAKPLREFLAPANPSL
jgi:hypothetical protein